MIKEFYRNERPIIWSIYRSVTQCIEYWLRWITLAFGCSHGHRRDWPVSRLASWTFLPPSRPFHVPLPLARDADKAMARIIGVKQRESIFVNDWRSRKLMFTLMSRRGRGYFSCSRLILCFFSPVVFLCVLCLFCVACFNLHPVKSDFAHTHLKPHREQLCVKVTSSKCQRGRRTGCRSRLPVTLCFCCHCLTSLFLLSLLWQTRAWEIPEHVPTLKGHLEN